MYRRPRLVIQAIVQSQREGGGCHGAMSEGSARSG
jgi:hypothetical protein